MPTPMTNTLFIFFPGAMVASLQQLVHDSTGGQFFEQLTAAATVQNTVNGQDLANVM